MQGVSDMNVNDGGSDKGEVQEAKRDSSLNFGRAIEKKILG